MKSAMLVRSIKGRESPDHASGTFPTKELCLIWAINLVGSQAPVSRVLVNINGDRTEYMFYGHDKYGIEALYGHCFISD